LSRLKKINCLIGVWRWIILALNRENLYMEIIRDDLCKNTDSIKSPEWHKAKKIVLILHYEN